MEHNILHVGAGLLACLTFCVTILFISGNLGNRLGKYNLFI